MRGTADVLRASKPQRASLSRRPGWLLRPPQADQGARSSSAALMRLSRVRWMSSPATVDEPPVTAILPCPSLPVVTLLSHKCCLSPLDLLILLQRVLQHERRQYQ
jgi:hypothetical protein